MPLLRNFTLLMVILVLPGCGFQLRGSSNIHDAYNPIYVERGALTSSQFQRVQTALKQAGAQLASSTANANRMQLKLNALPSRKLADSSLSGVELIQIRTRLEYVLFDSDNKVLIEQQSVEQAQQIELDSNNVLSQESVMNKSREALEKSLLRGLIFKLSQR